MTSPGAALGPGEGIGRGEDTMGGFSPRLGHSPRLGRGDDAMSIANLLASASGAGNPAAPGGGPRGSRPSARTRISAEARTQRADSALGSAILLGSGEGMTP